MNIVEILKLGSVGLFFLFAFLTYKLLASEQKQQEPRSKMLKPIYIFMVLLLIFGFASLFLEFYRIKSPVNNVDAKAISSNDIIDSEIQKLTEAHNKRIENLHKKYLEAEHQSTYGGNIDQYKDEYIMQSKRLTDFINKENIDFQNKVKELKTLKNPNP